MTARRRRSRDGALRVATFNIRHGATVDDLVRPVALAFPPEVSGTGLTGSTSYDVTFGYNGTFNALPEGLVAADVQSDMVVDDPADDINTALDSGVGITVHTVNVAAGSRYLRTALFDENTDGEDDLDVYVFDPDGQFAGGSGSPTSTEQVDLVDPVEGDWTVIVHGFETDGPDANYDLFNWVINGDEGNLTVTAPPAATLGATEQIDLSWTLPSAGRYLGLVRYDDGVNELGFTVVSVNAS